MSSALSFERFGLETNSCPESSSMLKVSPGFNLDINDGFRCNWRFEIAFMLTSMSVELTTFKPRYPDNGRTLNTYGRTFGLSKAGG